MKKSILCALMLSLAVLSFTPSPAGADDASSRRGLLGRRCITVWEMFKFMREINITEEQKAALKDLKDSADNASSSIMQAIAILQEEMTDAFLAADIDTSAAEAQIDQMLDLQSQLASIMLHAELQAVQILTAEQRALILEMVEKLRECDRGRGIWSSLKKPSYFSLIMPQKSFAK